MTVFVTCPACPGEQPTEIPDDVGSVDAALFAAAMAHDIACHVEALVA